MNIGARRRLAYVDTWRVIAVALVIAGHLPNNPAFASLADRCLPEFIGSYAAVGVFIFFFISGYVVSRSCLDELAATGNFSTVGFYIRRVFRIVPPLTFYLVVCATLSSIGVIHVPAESFIGASTYLCNTTLPFARCEWYTAHTWSLAFEEQFYLCFPLLFSFLAARNKLNPLIVPALAIAGIPFVFSVNWIGKTGFLLIHVLFFAGFLAARHPHLYERLAKSPYAVAIAFVAAIVVFFPVSFFNSLLVGKFFKFLYIPAIPALVLATAGSGGMLNRVFSIPLIASIGRATYSVYLWQQLFTGPPFSHMTPALQLFAILLMVCGSVALFATVERRLIRYGRELSMRVSASGRARPVPTAVG